MKENVLVLWKEQENRSTNSNVFNDRSREYGITL